MMPVRRHVGVLVKTYPKISETFILSELLGLERAGFELTIFSLQRPTDAIVQPSTARLRAAVVYLSDLDLAPARRLRRHASALAAAPLAWAGCWRQVLRADGGLGTRDVQAVLGLAALLRERGVAHLHAHFIDRTGEIGLRAADIAGIGCSLSAHAKDIYLTAPAALSRRVGEARFVATCTEYNRAALADVSPTGAAVHRIYHGVEASRFPPRRSRDAAAPLRLLAVGRLRPKKGFATLLEACSLLRSQGVELRCEIVGYGDEQARLTAMIARLGLREHVHLRGKMSHAGLLEVYREADVFVAPCEIAADGDRDGIPNVLLEAMATGLAVVSTPVSGIPELVIDGVNGLLVAPGDPQALASTLRGLANDRSRREHLGRAARQRVVEHFSEESNLRILAGLLERCIDEPGRIPMPELLAHG